VDAIDPHVDVVPVGKAALLEGAVLRLLFVGEPRDVRGGEPGGVLAEKRGKRLPEVARRETSEVGR
jgi:hypothetical protein